MYREKIVDYVYEPLFPDDPLRLGLLVPDRHQGKFWMLNQDEDLYNRIDRQSKLVAHVMKPVSFFVFSS